MNDVTELSRHAAPGGRPQPLAFVDGTLWVGSWDTSKLYAIEPKTWTVREEIDAPGQPYGLAFFDGALSVVVSHGEDDDRYLYRCVPGTGFDAESKTACPELTGSHLVSDGKALYLAQLTHRRLLELGRAGETVREIALPSACAGFCFDAGALYVISADDEFDELHFATLDLAHETPALTLLAKLPAEARGLAFDGTAWWTNLRELNQTVSFASFDVPALPVA
jgi:hypothetical protein